MVHAGVPVDELMALVRARARARRVRSGVSQPLMLLSDHEIAEVVELYRKGLPRRDIESSSRMSLVAFTASTPTTQLARSSPSASLASSGCDSVGLR
jgi:hypothetical protein